MPADQPAVFAHIEAEKRYGPHSLTDEQQRLLLELLSTPSDQLGQTYQHRVRDLHVVEEVLSDASQNRLYETDPRLNRQLINS